MVNRYPHAGRINQDPYLTSCEKITTKWIYNLNLGPESINLLEDIVGKNRSWQILFWIESQKNRQQRRKNRQVEFHQTKKFLHSKGNDQQSMETTQGTGVSVCLFKQTPHPPCPKSGIILRQMFYITCQSYAPVTVVENLLKHLVSVARPR